jgi:hypothetical protein
MVFVIHHRLIAVITFLCAWLSCFTVRLHADFEIESFTRYHVINMDNNNNGYVDEVDGDNLADNFESYAIAETIDKGGGLGPFLYVESRLPRQLTTLDGSEGQSGHGSIHVQFRTPGSFISGFVDLSTSVIDYEDLHPFRIPFERMQGSSYMQSRGVQVEHVIRFKPRLREEVDKREQTQTTWEIFYGARFYQFDDSYTFDANGGILGHTWAQTSVDNEHGGPHLGVGWSLNRGKWQFGVSGLLQAGFASADASQIAAIGEDLSPGQINSPYFNWSYAVNAQDDSQFGSLYGELRAQAERQITDQVTLTMGCSGYYFEDMRYADDSINWSVPEFGLTDNGTDDELITTAFASLEFRH